MKSIELAQHEIDALLNWHRDRETESASRGLYADAEWHKKRIGTISGIALRLPARDPKSDPPPAPECGPETTLARCPTGLFMFDGKLCFKSETQTENVNSGFPQTDAFTVPGGEYFWGGANSPPERESLIVRPVIWHDMDDDLSGKRLLQRVYDAITQGTGVHGDMMNEVREFLS